MKHEIFPDTFVGGRARIIRPDVRGQLPADILACLDVTHNVVLIEPSLWTARDVEVTRAVIALDRAKPYLANFQPR